MNKRIRIPLTLLTLFIMLCLSACGVSPEVRSQAKQNAKKYKNDFKQAVQSEMGADFSLSYINGGVDSYGSIFPAGYAATDYLNARVKQKGGKKYNARYYFNSRELETDAFNDEVVLSCADALGLERSRLIKYMGDAPERHASYMLPADVHTIEDALKEKIELSVFYVTDQDVELNDLQDYVDLCLKNGCKIYVHIFCSDDFQNEEDFHKNYWQMRDVGADNKNPSVYSSLGPHKPNDPYVDIFPLYNLKGYVFVDGCNVKGQVSVLQYDGTNMTKTVYP